MENLFMVTAGRKTSSAKTTVPADLVTVHGGGRTALACIVGRTGLIPVRVQPKLPRELGRRRAERATSVADRMNLSG